MRRLARALAVTSFTLPFVAAAALVASADEGSTGRHVAASPLIRPPIGVLRHVDAPTASPIPLRAPARELVVLVGGYGSCACPDDGSFDALKARLAELPNYTVVRFGTDPRFPYDTSGHVERNAENLRDEIRTLAPDYSGVHIVAHSMGGVVADRAFASGLSHADGVTTYVAWSSPHSGSNAAQALVVANAVIDGRATSLRDGLRWLRRERETAAIRDLASTSPLVPPAGVVRLDLREASDVLVTRDDARDPGVPSRTLDNAAEGHGGILTDPMAIDLTVRTITSRIVPPEERSRSAVRDAERKSSAVNTGVFMAVCALAALAIVYAGATAPLLRRPIDVLRSLIPRVMRKPCA